MERKVSICLYWGPRIDGLMVCCDRLVRTIELLSSIDVTLSNWYSTKRPKKSIPILPITLDREAFKDLLLKGQNKNDIGKVLDDIGYNVILKSEKDFAKAHVLMIHCNSSNELLVNSIVLEIGSVTSTVDLESDMLLKHIYKGLYSIWASEYGKIDKGGIEIPTLGD
jgi:hypothetical protein